MKSLQDILTEISKFKNKPLPNDCAHDDGFDDFLHAIDNKQAIIKSNRKHIVSMNQQKQTV